MRVEGNLKLEVHKFFEQDIPRVIEIARKKFGLELLFPSERVSVSV